APLAGEEDEPREGDQDDERPDERREIGVDALQTDLGEDRREGGEDRREQGPVKPAGARSSHRRLSFRVGRQSSEGSPHSMAGDASPAGRFSGGAALRMVSWQTGVERRKRGWVTGGKALLGSLVHPIILLVVIVVRRLRRGSRQWGGRLRLGHKVPPGRHPSARARPRLRELIRCSSGASRFAAQGRENRESGQEPDRFGRVKVVLGRSSCGLSADFSSFSDTSGQNPQRGREKGAGAAPTPRRRAEQAKTCPREKGLSGPPLLVCRRPFDRPQKTRDGRKKAH